MKIRTRLYASAFAAIGLLGLLFVLLLIFSFKVNKEREKEILANEFHVAAISIIALSHQYADQRSQRAALMLEKRINSVEMVIKKSEEKIQLDIIRNAFASLKNSYGHLKTIYKERKEIIRTNKNSAEIERTLYLEEAMVTLLLTESYKIMDIASRITKEARTNMTRLEKKGIQVLMTFSFLLVVVIGTSTLRIAKGISLPLNSLTRSANLIRTGDLDTTIPDLGRDEFGELARTLDSMRKSRRKNEMELRESRLRYQLLAENLNVGIWHANPDGSGGYINPKLIELTGLSPEEASGDGWALALHPDDQEKVYKEWTGFVEGRSPYHLTYRFKHPDGSIRWVIGQAVTVYSQEGEIVGHIGSMTDITEIKRMEEEKTKMEERLFQSQKMEAIGSLAGGIAHDFNNILSAIYGYSEIAMDDIDKPDNLKNHLKEILIGADRARGLVSQILTFSRKSEQEMQPLNISIMLKEVIKMLKATIPATIEIRSKFNTNAFVFADPTQIHSLAMNLGTNAYHAMKETGGILTVILNEMEIDREHSTPLFDVKPGSYLRLEVTDTGHGIDKETVKRIFDPYFTTKDKGQGTGLGLAVVLGIVKDHQGYVFVDSEPEKGTTFHIYLPIADKKAIDSFSKVTEKRAPLKGNGKILFVDDEIKITELADIILTKYGYTVKTCSSPIQAFNKFEKTPEYYDLVITDMTMPKMTGLVLAQKILSVKPNIPVILCTGHSDLINKEEALTLGIKRFLKKPFRMSELTDIIKNTLNESQA